MGSLRDREVACSASDRQGSNFESCVWRTVSSHSSHHPQEVLLAQFSLYVHKCGLKPGSFHFSNTLWSILPKCEMLSTTRRCVASQFVITFQFVINYYKLERICNTIASQFVINYYKLERICTAAASQFVINYYKLARICNVFAFQFVIKYYILDDTQSTLENKGERSLPLSSRYGWMWALTFS